MAEPCTKAFGRYLRILRERRDLSLDDVQSLSQAFADPVSKAYLSRCENGHQLPAVSKLIPLSRIYEAPVEVLTERMELDMELDRVGGPETSGLTYGELRDAARLAVCRGHSWHTYAYYRDAVPLATPELASTAPDTLGPRLPCATMNVGSAAFRLDRVGFPLHEFQFLAKSVLQGSKLDIVLHERVSQCLRRLGRYDESRAAADQAVQGARELGDQALLGYALSNRGVLANGERDPESACVYYRGAFASYRKAGLSPECATAMNNLAQAYFDLGRLQGARRAIQAARTIALPLELHRTLALGRILLAEIEMHTASWDRAKGYLREAIDTARAMNDRVLRFKAEYLMLRLVASNGERAAARALERRLSRLAPWMPADVPEVVEFRKNAC